MTDKETENMNMPDYKNIREFRNAMNTFGDDLGIVTTKITAGHAECELPVTERFLNPIGSIHGGCLFTIADIAAGSAAASGGTLMTTVSSDFHFLTPGIGCRTLYAAADAIKEGKQICVYEVKVKDENGKILAEGTFTYFNLGKPIPTDFAEKMHIR